MSFVQAHHMLKVFVILHFSASSPNRSKASLPLESLLVEMGKATLFYSVVCKG